MIVPTFRTALAVPHLQTALMLPKLPVHFVHTGSLNCSRSSPRPTQQNAPKDPASAGNQTSTSNADAAKSRVLRHGDKQKRARAASTSYSRKRMPSASATLEQPSVATRSRNPACFPSLSLTLSYFPGAVVGDVCNSGIWLREVRIRAPALIAQIEALIVLAHRNARRRLMRGAVALGTQGSPSSAYLHRRAYDVFLDAARRGGIRVGNARNLHDPASLEELKHDALAQLRSLLRNEITLNSATTKSSSLMQHGNFQDMMLCLRASVHLQCSSMADASWARLLELTSPNHNNALSSIGVAVFNMRMQELISRRTRCNLIEAIVLLGQRIQNRGELDAQTLSIIASGLMRVGHSKEALELCQLCCTSTPHDLTIACSYDTKWIPRITPKLALPAANARHVVADKYLLLLMAHLEYKVSHK